MTPQNQTIVRNLIIALLMVISGLLGYLIGILQYMPTGEMKTLSGPVKRIAELPPSMPNPGAIVKNDRWNHEVFKACPHHIGGVVKKRLVLDQRCYITNGDLIVKKGGVLEIKAGVAVGFNPGHGLKIGKDGRFHAAGTSEKPVRLTGLENKPGYWQGVEFSEHNQRSLLEYVIVENGGSNAKNGAANIKIDDASFHGKVTIRHSILRGSAGFGFHLGGRAGFVFESNSVNGNRQTGWIGADAMGRLDDKSKYSGNKTDRIRVARQHWTRDQTWPALQVPFEIQDSWQKIKSHIHVNAGARLVFDRRGGLSVEGGSLNAIGEEDKPIVFTGIVKQKGYWNGIAFYDNKKPSRLENVVIEYGGGDRAYPANLWVNDKNKQADLQVSRSLIRGSASYGFLFRSGARVQLFSRNRVSGNAWGAGMVAGNSLGLLGAGNLYKGNDKDMIFVARSEITRPVTLPALDVPYVFATQWHKVSAPIRIEAGALLKFSAGAGLHITRSGSLSAVGLAGKPIVFTGLERKPGFWRGLLFKSSNSSSNQLKRVVVRYAGGLKKYPGSINITGSRSAPAKLILLQSEITQGAAEPLWMRGSVRINADVESANRFHNNKSNRIKRHG